MNVLDYRVSLDMFDTLSQITIKAKKGDSACKIHITLTKQGKIYKMSEGCYATLSAKKSDGNFIYDKCTIENNTIVYNFLSSVDENGVCQVSACEGIVECEVTLYKADSEQLTSPRFTLFVDGTVYNGEEISSSSESDVLKEFIRYTKSELTKKSGVWQPNTEYKVGDIVLGNLWVDEFPNYITVMLMCLQDHKSPNVDCPNDDENFGSCWNWTKANAWGSLSALQDGNGNNISETYPKKYSGCFEDDFLIYNTKISKGIISVSYDPNNVGENRWITKVKIGDIYADTSGMRSLLCISAENGYVEWQEISTKALYKQIDDINKTLDQIGDINEALETALNGGV